MMIWHENHSLHLGWQHIMVTEDITIVMWKNHQFVVSQLLERKSDHNDNKEE
jgi:hypothetical protein